MTQSRSSDHRWCRCRWKRCRTIDLSHCQCKIGEQSLHVALRAGRTMGQNLSSEAQSNSYWLAIRRFLKDSRCRVTQHGAAGSSERPEQHIFGDLLSDRMVWRKPCAAICCDIEGVGCQSSAPGSIRGGGFSPKIEEPRFSNISRAAGRWIYCLQLMMFIEDRSRLDRCRISREPL
jgi:hypothetical protein